MLFIPFYSRQVLTAGTRYETGIGHEISLPMRNHHKIT